MNLFSKFTSLRFMVPEQKAKQLLYTKAGHAKSELFQNIFIKLSPAKTATINEQLRKQSKQFLLTKTPSGYCSLCERATVLDSPIEVVQVTKFVSRLTVQPGSVQRWSFKDCPPMPSESGCPVW